MLLIVLLLTLRIPVLRPDGELVFSKKAQNISLSIFLCQERAFSQILSLMFRGVTKLNLVTLS